MPSIRDWWQWVQHPQALYGDEPSDSSSHLIDRIDDEVEELKGTTQRLRTLLDELRSEAGGDE